MDDVLGHGVGRGGLGAEQHRDGPGRLVAALDLAVFVDDPQGVHLLALVLVQALDLDVKDGVFVHFHPLALAQQGLQLALVVLLDLQQAGKALRVVGKGQQLLQPGGVPGPAVPDPLGDPVGQGGVAGFQPAAEGDAVGLVVELFRVQVVEGLQLAGLEDVGVQGGHAVHRVAVVDVHVGHVHPAPLVQDGHPAVAAALAGPAVQLLDDGHDLGGHRLDIVQGPLFQGLGQDGVVGVGAGLFHLFHCGVEGQALLGQQADQLGDDHGGVGVVDLDGHMLAEGVGAEAAGGQLVQDQLGARRHHEVLLVDPQQLAVPVAVVGVEEGGQAVGDVPLVKVDAVGGGLGRVGHVKEVQPVGHLAVGPGDGDVVEHRIQRKTAEGDGIGLAGGQQPAFGLDPGVGLLLLAAVHKFLVEQAVMVVQAHAVAGQVQRGDGIQETGGQAAQAAVAQRGLRLVLLQGGQRAAHLIQQRPHRTKQAQGQQVVAQQLAHQELGREIVELALPRGGGPAGGQLLGQGQQGVVELGVGAGVGLAGKALGGERRQLLLDFVSFHRELPPFLL